MAASERRAAIVLGTVIVAVLILGVWLWLPRLRGGGETGSPAPSAAVTPAPGPAAPPAPASGDAALAERPIDLGAYDRDTPAGPAGRDPFTPPLAARTAQPTRVAYPVRRPLTPAPRRTNDLAPLLPGGDLAVRPAGVPAPPEPPIELKGVIPGDPAIAVVNIGGEVHYKQEGDSLGAGLRIARITEAGAVIQRAGRNVVLDVGHTLPQAPAPSPVVAPSPVPAPTPHVEKPPVEKPTAPRAAERAASEAPANRAVRRSSASEAPDVTVSAKPKPAPVRRSRVRHRRVTSESSSDRPLEGHFVGRRL